MTIYSVLMAGGVGTRFWPRSRETSPKQVLNIVGEQTMIQATHRRLKNLSIDENVLVVTNSIQKQLIHEQIPQLKDKSFLIEPFGRNTAPCIGLAAVHVAAQDPNGIMMVLPADHVISNVDEFESVMKLAANFADEHNALVTMGITPYEPATGYGYIQGGKVAMDAGEHKVLKVRTFAEKPNLDTATRFLESGDFFWNSGMFVWKATAILQEFEKLMPEMHDLLMEIADSIGSPNYQNEMKNAYERMQNVSIDVGIMQRSERVYVIPANMGWNDVGSWETVYDISAKDKHNNAGRYRELVNVGSQGCLAYSPDKIVALVGVEDLLVVDTGDALLVCHKSAAQDVKHIVDELKKKGLKQWL